MGLLDALAGLAGRFATGLPTPELARAESVARLMPPGTVYVSFGAVLIADDVARTVGTPGRRRWEYKFGAPPAEHPAWDRGRPAAGGGPGDDRVLLVLADHRLRVIGPEGERWSVHAASVTDVDAHQRADGFAVVTDRGDGLLVSRQTPVEVPSGATWRTVPRVTNAFSHWDVELEPYGVRVHW